MINALYGLLQELAEYFLANFDPFRDLVEVEAPIPESIRDELRSLGHDIRPARKPIGGSQAISIDWDTDLLTAGSDPRKDGCAMGY